MENPDKNSRIGPNVVFDVNKKELEYLTNKEIIDRYITQLDKKGVEICEEIHKSALIIHEMLEDPNIKSIIIEHVQKLSNLINDTYKSKNCYPECINGQKNTTCLECNTCEPTCDVKNPSLKCPKCVPHLATFDNSKRLRTNKLIIDTLLLEFLSGNNQFKAENTMSIIKIRLSVLPSFVS